MITNPLYLESNIEKKFSPTGNRGRISTQTTMNSPISDSKSYSK